ncbi:hypothetical protein BT69DRAFT_1293600 [Atractiella rhizophila]|nr:hypothetical protein BT69DRAFT_1293600 [Atractiella rhizophila]
MWFDRDKNIPGLPVALSENYSTFFQGGKVYRTNHAAKAVLKFWQEKKSYARTLRPNTSDHPQKSLENLVCLDTPVSLSGASAGTRKMSRSDDEEDAFIAKKYLNGITFTPRTPVSRPPQIYSSLATLPHYKPAPTPVRGPDALEDYIQLEWS